jgi:hypothetical protein
MAALVASRSTLIGPLLQLIRSRYAKMSVVAVTRQRHLRGPVFAGPLLVDALAGVEADSHQSWSGSYVRLRITTNMSVIAKMSAII